MIYHTPKLKIVATILARDEEDIIGHTIEHHLAHGISQFIVTDNNSRDNTRKIVEKYPEVVQIIDELGEDHHQAKWVTRMAREACKLKPDWIIHLDADEMWCGLDHLRRMQKSVVGSVRMFLHPPAGDGIETMGHYLDFRPLGMDEECKVCHRPDPNIEITHGNHGVIDTDVEYTTSIYRHHYPLRSYRQFERKTVQGHEALMKRGAICERWHLWYKAWQDGRLPAVWNDLITAWTSMRAKPNHSSLDTLLAYWAEPQVRQLCAQAPLPKVGFVEFSAERSLRAER